jgi:YVTN family beta-propeller protein
LNYAAYYISILSFVLALALSSTFLGLERAWADSVTATIPVGNFPTYDKANGNIYVPNYEGDSVSVISGQTNTVIGNPIPVGQLPWGTTFDPSNRNLYVTNEGDSTVSVISGQTNTVIGDPIHVKSYISSSSPTGIAFDLDNSKLYVANWSK